MPREKTKKGGGIVWVLAAALAIQACGGANPRPAADPTINLTASGRAAYEAKKVVAALDIMRDVAIAGEAQNPPVFTTAATTRVVQAHRDVVRAIGVTPNGWRPLLDQALTSLQKDLQAAEWQQIAPYAALLRALMAQYGGTR